MTSTQAHFSYTVQDALDDGTFVKVFEKDWPALSGGHPIVATRTLYDALSQVALIEVYNGYVHWVNEIAPTLPTTERRFTTRVQGRDVSVAQDGSSLNMFWADED